MKKWSCVIITILVLSSRAWSAEYAVHCLGVLSNTHMSCAISINNSGKAIGWSSTSYDARGAFSWTRNEGIKDIRIPNEFDYGGGAINDDGQIVGSRSSSNGCSGGAVILEPDGSVTLLPSLSGLGCSGGDSINNSGNVAGYTNDQAAIWIDGELAWYADGTYSQATDINNHNQAIWNAHNFSDGTAQAYIWDNYISIPLALLEGTQMCWGYSINDSGVVVGRSGDYAVLWQQNGTAINLASDTQWWSEALDINSDGWVVGQIDCKATLWNPNGSLIDLSHFVNGYESIAYGINDNGWIVGSVSNPDGFRQAVVWEPVPEPSSLLALALGLIATGSLIKRRNK
ncbi:MAG: PEP-CTERM sorting domain-containing protein [Armatimonadota bacterium]